MKAIRGATTLGCDTAEEVRTATRELLQSIAKINGLKNDEIVCMMFSSTADIKSLYPAKAAREAGFSDCALYSSLEPDMWQKNSIYSVLIPAPCIAPLR